MKITSHNDRFLSGTIIVISAVAGCMFLTWRMSARVDQTVVAGLLIFVMIELALVSPTTAIVTAMIYQVINGDLRRVLMAIAGRTGNDPLLLVAPAVMATLLSVLLVKGELHTRSRLSRMMIWLTILMIVQALNPLQGGLNVGAVGLFLYLCPICWYWIGQSFGTDEFLEKLFVRTLVPMAIIASLFSYYQATFGLFDYQYDWMVQTGMISQAVGNVLRPSGFFPSPTEMGAFVSISALILWAGVLTRKRMGLGWLIPVLLWAAFLQGSRGIVLTTLFVGCLMWAMSGRSLRAWLPRFAIAVVIGFGGLIYTMTHVEESGTANAMLKHQASGMLDPSQSTAQAHGSMMLSGILIGTFVNPLGYGIGATTLAAANVDSSVGNMEVDFSNIFLSLGVVGGLLYLSIMALILTKAVKLWIRSRTFASLALVGICVDQIGHYLTGMHFAMGVIVWFCIGSLERQSRGLEDHSLSLSSIALDKTHRSYNPVSVAQA
jgi:hypothetical protein